MRFGRILSTIDAHCAGEPLRIITGGLPPIPGATVLERRRYLREHLDEVRRALLFEPRGHADMYGCVLSPPVTPGADLSVCFLHTAGYSTMCGHGVIALVTALIETGQLLGREPTTEVRLDTPAGPVVARAEVRAGRVLRVAFQNVPSFVFARDVRVEVPGLGAVRADVAYGGAFYAFVRARDLGLRVAPEQLRALVDAGERISRAVERALVVRHPLEPELRDIYGTVLTDEPSDPSAHGRNVTIFAERQVDRSPCGTGTAARLALLHAQGALAVGEPYVHESILGTRFTGRILGTTQVADYPAVVPEVAGSAHITGFHHFVVDPEDPLAEGFLLRA
jgi:proline racemase